MNLDDLVKEMEAFQRKVMGSMLDDFGSSERFKSFSGFGSKGFDPFEGIKENFGEFERDFMNDRPEGEWRFERIDRPGVKGFIARGIFTHPEILKKPDEILPPLRPEPGRPRRPLYDIHAEEGQLKVYVELPGVEEGVINLEVIDGVLRLHAEDFEEEIDLTRWMVNSENMVTSYSNGVLEVTIPKEELDEQMI